MLAQLNTPTPDSYIAWQVVLTIGVLFSIGVNVLQVVRSNRAQKRQVSFQFEPASKEAFDEHVRDTRHNFDQVRNELKEDRQANQVHASARAASLYKKIDEVRAELAAKVENMPDRIIAQLRNTKGLLD